MTECILDINPKELGCLHYVYHFVDPDLGVEMFCEKEGATDKVVMILKWGGGLRHLYTLVLGVEENFIQSQPAFLLFFGDKKE